MGGVGIWIAEEIGQGDSREGVVVGVGGFVEFDHFGDGIGVLRRSTA